MSEMRSSLTGLLPRAPRPEAEGFADTAPKEPDKKRRVTLVRPREGAEPELATLASLRKGTGDYSNLRQEIKMGDRNNEVSFGCACGLQEAGGRKSWSSGEPSKPDTEIEKH